jgi:hypothetical protein
MYKNNILINNKKVFIFIIVLEKINYYNIVINKEIAIIYKSEIILFVFKNNNL